MAQALTGTTPAVKRPSPRQPRNNIPLDRKIRNWCVALSSVFGIAALLWGGFITVNKYITEQFVTQRQAQLPTLLDAQQPFLKRQTDLYFETAAVIGDLMTIDPKEPKWSDQERRFWALYYSELSMVENCSVARAMVGFGDALNAYKDQVSKENRFAMGSKAILLAHALHSGMAESWTGKLASQPCGGG